MSDAPNSIFFTHVMVRSFILGLMLGGFVYVGGSTLGLWSMDQAWKIFGLVIVGCLLLLPIYERLSGFR